MPKIIVFKHFWLHEDFSNIMDKYIINKFLYDSIHTYNDDTSIEENEEEYYEESEEENEEEYDEESKEE